MAQTATDLTKEQLNKLNKEWLSKGYMLNPDGTLSPVLSGDKDKDELLKKASDEYNATLLAKGKADNKIAKTAEIGNTAMNVAGGVLGLGQMIGGAKILGKTKAPKYPYEQLPNQQLSALLGDVQRLSQIGDPIIREKMMRDMAMQNAKSDAVAKVSSGGDVASYAAQSQVNSSANNDAIRNIGASELAFKTQQGNILDGLIAQKIQEDNARQKGKIDKFGIDYNEFKAKRNYGEQLVNKGIGNVFNAGIGAGQNATVLARTAQNDKLFAEQTPKATTPPLNLSTPVTDLSTPVTVPQFNLSGLLPNTYETMNGKNPTGIGVLKPIVKGDGSLLSYGQQQTTTPTAQPTATITTPQFNLSGLLPNAYETMNGKAQPSIGALLPIRENKDNLLPFGRIPTVQPMPIIPKWVKKEYKKGNMEYMGPPDGYMKYLSKVSKLKANQIYNKFKNKINPLTGKMYSIQDVPVLVKSMTDGNIGENHKEAQTLINELGL